MHDRSLTHETILESADLALAAQTVIDLFVFGFEFESRGLGLELQKCAEIDMFLAVADHALYDLAGERGQGLGDAEIATSLEPEIEILSQQIGCEGRRPIKIDEGRRLIFCEQRPHHALVDEVQKSMARHATLFGQNRDLG